MGRKRNRFAQVMGEVDAFPKHLNYSNRGYSVKASSKSWAREASKLSSVHSTFSEERRWRRDEEKVGVQRTIRERLESIRRSASVDKNNSVSQEESLTKSNTDRTDKRLERYLLAISTKRSQIPNFPQSKFQPMSLLELCAYEVARDLHLYRGFEDEFASQIPLDFRQLVLRSASSLVWKRREWPSSSKVDDRSIMMFLDKEMRSLCLGHSRITDASADSIVDCFQIKSLSDRNQGHCRGAPDCSNKCPTDVNTCSHSVCETNHQYEQGSWGSEAAGSGDSEKCTGADTCAETTCTGKCRTDIRSFESDHTEGDVAADWEWDDEAVVLPNAIVLTHLDVSFCFGISGKFMNTISRNLITLSSLNISGSFNTEDGRYVLKLIGEPSSFPNLRELDVSFNDWVTSESLNYSGILNYETVCNHPSLVTLKLRHCPNFPSSELEDAWSHAVRIKCTRPSSEYTMTSLFVVPERRVTCLFADVD